MKEIMKGEVTITLVRYYMWITMHGLMERTWQFSRGGDKNRCTLLLDGIKETECQKFWSCDWHEGKKKGRELG